jgi:molybdenum cofactor synthesis domain-containing protein
MRAAILTISTSAAAGESEDRSGPALADAAREAGCEIAAQEVITDDLATVEAALRRLSAPDQGISMIFTTGGTGFTPDDVTPEATLNVIDRQAPGYAEALRAEALKYTPMGIMTRGVSGIAQRTLIINFPGNPKAIGELFPVVAPTLKHVVGTLNRERGRFDPAAADHGRPD